MHQILQAIDTETQPVKVSFQEIYLDQVRDLLNTSNVMTQNNQSSRYEVTMVEVRSAERVFQLLSKAEQNR